MKKIFIMTVVVMSVIYSQNNPDLQQLAREYFQWRTATQPVTPDDVPRVARTDGWVPDFSPAALRDYRQQYQQFRSALASIPQTGWTRSDSVDYLLLRSAIERVNWELNVLNLPGTHPEFYVQQTLGSVFDLLIISSTFTEQRIDNLIRRLNAVPGTLDAARGNLTDPVQP
ncbi:MAG: DUF885 family protein, partial [Fidelibacterota bacterium]